MHDERLIGRKYERLKQALDERGRRLWAGTEADVLGHGGVAAVARATGLAISTVRKGRDEVRRGALQSDVVRIRRPGAGRPRVEEQHPEIKATLRALVDPSSRGDPQSPLCWTLKSTRVLSSELAKAGYPISPQKVSELLHAEGFSLQGTSRVKEGESHPDRDQQFLYINTQTQDFMRRGVPVVSVDTKKKELVGEHGNAGKEWQPKGQAVEVLTYDFPDPAMRKAIPYGVYDLADNSAHVNVGTDHDTPHFAVHSLETWWTRMGTFRYPKATELFVTADGGGSNGYRCHAWKAELQKLADRHQLTIHVSHFPPGTSKWNKIEHRLFSFITLNWRGRPLTTYETIVSLIASTTTQKGLRVQAQLDLGKYPCGETVSKKVLSTLALQHGTFHGEWNYTLHPRSPQQMLAAAAAALAAKSQAPWRGKLSWFELVHEQTQSGLSGAEFCRRRGLRYGTFSTWRTKLGPSIYPGPAKWQKLVDEQLASGLRVAEFCRRRGINKHAFHKWLKRLAGKVTPRLHAKWAEHIRDQRLSGKKPQQYCLEQGLNYRTLLYWRRRLGTLSLGETTTD